MPQCSGNMCPRPPHCRSALRRRGQTAPRTSSQHHCSTLSSVRCSRMELGSLMLARSSHRHSGNNCSRSLDMSTRKCRRSHGMCRKSFLHLNSSDRAGRDPRMWLRRLMLACPYRRHYGNISPRSLHNRRTRSRSNHCTCRTSTHHHLSAMDP